jgi:hypothetical protein
MPPKFVGKRIESLGTTETNQRSSSPEMRTLSSNSEMGTKAVRLRFPEQLVRVLCALTHSSPHDRTPHPGHLYLNTFLPHSSHILLHSDETLGDPIFTPPTLQTQKQKKKMPLKTHAFSNHHSNCCCNKKKETQFLIKKKLAKISKSVSKSRRPEQAALCRHINRFIQKDKAI